MHQTPSLQDIGLPALEKSLNIHSLAWSAPAETLVLVLQPRKFVNPTDQRIFVRRISDLAYREISVPIERPSIHGTVLCPLTPELFLAANSYRSDDRTGADSAGLFAVSLPDGMPLPLPPPTLSDEGSTVKARDPRISQLLGASPHGNVLHVVAAVPNRSPTGYSFTYHLADYSRDTGALTLLGRLPAVFA